MFKTHSWQIQNRFKKFWNFFWSKYFWTKKCFWSQTFLDPNFFNTLALIHKTFMFKTHSWQIQNRFKKFWKIFWSRIFLDPKFLLVPNIFEPKFLLDLSYDSHSIHVQNTFPTDSKKVWNFFWMKIYLDPKCFRSQIFLDPNFFYTLAMLHIAFMFKTHSRQIQNRFKKFEIFFYEYFPT